MHFKWSFLVVLSILFLSQAVIGATLPCNKLQVQNAQGKKLTFNLDSLTKLDQPFAIDAPNPGNPTETYTYEVAVCKNFNCAGAGVSSSGVCQEWHGGAASAGAYGASIEAHYLEKGSASPNGGIQVVARGGDLNRFSYINIICDKNAKTPKLTSVQSATSLTEPYVFFISSKAGCPVGGLSPGSILLITLVCLAAAVFIFGSIVNKFAFHKEGIEIVPFGAFLIDLPSLCKDGVMFVVNKVRGGPPSYEQVA